MVSARSLASWLDGVEITNAKFSLSSVLLSYLSPSLSRHELKCVFAILHYFCPLSGWLYKNEMMIFFFWSPLRLSFLFSRHILYFVYSPPPYTHEKRHTKRVEEEREKIVLKPNKLHANVNDFFSFCVCLSLSLSLAIRIKKSGNTLQCIHKQSSNNSRHSGVRINKMSLSHHHRLWWIIIHRKCKAIQCHPPITWIHQQQICWIKRWAWIIITTPCRQRHTIINMACNLTTVRPCTITCYPQIRWMVCLKRVRLSIFTWINNILIILINNWRHKTNIFNLEIMWE